VVYFSIARTFSDPILIKPALRRIGIQTTVTVQITILQESDTPHTIISI
jgi:hypothetical protein